jgi:hypothetical protein
MNPARPRSHRSINLLSWLIPLTYVVHIAEEYWGGEGYPAYISRVQGVYLSPNRFLVAQAIGFALLTIGIILGRKFNFPAMMLLILSTTAMGNALTHSFHAITSSSYNPGLLSSVLIWLPLGIFLLIRFKPEMSSTRYWLAIAIAGSINVVIAVITLRGGRLV